MKHLGRSHSYEYRHEDQFRSGQGLAGQFIINWLIFSIAHHQSCFDQAKRFVALTKPDRSRHLAKYAVYTLRKVCGRKSNKTRKARLQSSAWPTWAAQKIPEGFKFHVTPCSVQLQSSFAGNPKGLIEPQGNIFSLHHLTSIGQYRKFCV